jgi:DNA-binding transcriptional MerR regulator
MEEITYSINEVSERLGVSYRSLHYWEEKLVIPINRDGTGNRVYSESDFDLLAKVKELKLKGMSLDGIKELFQEKGLLQKSIDAPLIVVDERSMELKDYILGEIREVVSQELANTNSKLDQIIQDNQTLRQDNDSLREELRKLQRQSEDHYSKIDSQLSAWRSKKPWYKSIFKGNE